MPFGDSVEKETTDFDSSFVNIDYEIDGKDFNINIEEILVLEHDDESTYTAYEIECQLEKCSYYKHIVFQAYIVQKQARKRKEREFNSWYALAEKTADTVITREKKKEEFSPSAIVTFLSSNKLRNFVMSHPDLESQYETYSEEIATMYSQEDTLNQLADNISSREMILMAMMKRNREM